MFRRLSRIAGAGGSWVTRAVVRRASGVMCACLLAACASGPKKENTAPALGYEQLLDNGQQAHKTGDALQAVHAWREAARVNPTAKEPWLRIAQLHFDAGDYGQAITAAQEARQRDAQDATANGLLAVSGLRVSSDALARLRGDTLTGSTRAEAEALAKTLREMLGTAVLVPTPAAARPAPARAAKADASPPRPARASAPAAPVPSGGSSTSAPALKWRADDKAASGSRDPFSALR